MIQKIKPHLIVIGSLVLLVVLGIATNSGKMGQVLGLLIVTATQPFTILAAIGCGLIFDYRKFLKVSIPVGLAVVIFGVLGAYNTRSELGLDATKAFRPGLLFGYFYSFLVIAHSVNLLRLLLSKTSVTSAQQADDELMDDIKAGREAFRQRFGTTSKISDEDMLELYKKKTSSEKVANPPKTEFDRSEKNPSAELEGQKSYGLLYAEFDAVSNVLERIKKHRELNQEKGLPETVEERAFERKWQAERDRILKEIENLSKPGK